MDNQIKQRTLLGEATEVLLRQAKKLSRYNKHIPIKYYEPIEVTYNFDGLENEDNLVWENGQPYEIKIIGGEI